MLIVSLNAIGKRLLELRSKSGFTQWEVAELAGISDRTYADIERGNVNMRIETFMNICNALKATPNEVLIDPDTAADNHAKETEECKKSKRFPIYALTLNEDSHSYGTSGDRANASIDLFDALSHCSPHEHETALSLLAVYINSLQ